MALLWGLDGDGILFKIWEGRRGGVRGENGEVCGAVGSGYISGILPCYFMDGKIPCEVSQLIKETHIGMGGVGMRIIDLISSLILSIAPNLMSECGRWRLDSRVQ
jgi:hypothetical protein